MNIIYPLSLKKLISFIFLITVLGIQASFGQVVYTDYQPDLQLEPKDIRLQDNRNYYYFDVNNDSSNDFRLSVSPEWDGDILISILNFNGTQFVKPFIDDKIDTILIHQIIDSTKIWTSDVLYPIGGDYYSTYQVPLYNMFVGFRIKNVNGYNYGWLRFGKNSVKDFAINFTTDSSIIVGEQILLKPENVQISDIGDIKDGRELQLSFEKLIDETIIKKYCVYLVKTSEAEYFNTEKALKVKEGNLRELIPDGNDKMVLFDSLSKDINGDPLTEFTSYNAFVLSYPKNGEPDSTYLSYPSNALTLKSYTTAATKLKIDSYYLEGKKYKLVLSFDKIADESTLKEYRVLFVDENQSKYFTVDSAKCSYSYYVIKPSNNNYSFDHCSDTLKDYKGNSLSSVNNYRFFVLSVPDGVIKNEAVLSVGSNTIKLSTPVDAPYLLLAEDNGSSGNASDVRLKIVNPDEMKGISSYKVLAVKSNKFPRLDINSLNRKTIGYYTDIDPGKDTADIFLKPSFKDTDGDEIKEHVSYRFYILSIADSLRADTDKLSNFSCVLSLSTPDYFKAGQKTGQDVYYTDIEPDIETSIYGETLTKDYDFSNDSISDLKIILIHYISPGNNGSNISISAFRNAYFNILPDSSFPEPLTLNSTISEDLMWHQKKMIIAEDDFFYRINVPGPWMRMKNRYMGFKVKNGNNLIYGWVGFELPFYYYYRIRDYAFKIYKTSEIDTTDELDDSDQFSIYPNPANSYFGISYSGKGKMETITITDYLGKVVKQHKIEKNYSVSPIDEVDISEFKRGVYIVRLTTDKGVYSRKLIIK
jgi:hypothetical protein